MTMIWTTTALICGPDNAHGLSFAMATRGKTPLPGPHPTRGVECINADLLPGTALQVSPSHGEWKPWKPGANYCLATRPVRRRENERFPELTTGVTTNSLNEQEWEVPTF